MTLLALERLSAQRGNRQVLQDISLAVYEGEFIGLLGPNGAGKTTLMRAALGLIPARGHSNLADMERHRRARQVAWLPQNREIAWPVTVEQVVTLGRMPHLPQGQRPRPADTNAINAALARMGLEDFRHRIATRLSGGEQARVLIARALAQETPLLMADEPAAGLDPANQIALMTRFAETAAAGRTVIAAMHDLGLAVRHCTRLVVLDQGRLVADGRPEEVLTPALLAETFQISAHYRTGPDGPVFQPLTVIA